MVGKSFFSVMKICFVCSMGIKLYAWGFKQEAFDKECLKCSVKLATFFVALAFIIIQGPGSLRVVSTKINSEMYQELLECFMIPSSQVLCDDNFMIPTLLN